MIRLIGNIIKKIVVSTFLLYGFNLIVAPLNIIIPINIITVLAISVLGLPALFSFLIILILIY